MSSLALIHGAGVGGGWFWHLVEAELGPLGHTTIARTLWTDEESVTLAGSPHRWSPTACPPRH